MISIAGLVPKQW